MIVVSAVRLWARLCLLALVSALLLSVSIPSAFAEIDDKSFAALEYRLVGPFRGGRVTAVAGVASDPHTYYMGATGGGVWVTRNAGRTWQNISDGHFTVGSVGAIAVAPSDPNVIYAGTGTSEIRGVAASHGDGVYRSTDRGRTWNNIGLGDSRQISAIVVHPHNPDVVWVAAQGSPWAPSEQRGVFKSTDGGASWHKVLYINETTGASDLVIDATNPRILYAAMWDHQRSPWEIRSGGEGSGLYKSTDGGESWDQLTGGLPELMGKTGVAVSPANPDRVWAIVEAEGKKGGLYRSDDGGKSFTHINGERTLHARAWYYMHVLADPLDENTVYVQNTQAHKSVDGGKSFTPFATQVHVDHHNMWINPANPDIIIDGNDGGATITLDGGATWSSQYNQPTVQFYRVNADHGFPYKIYGGQQDNSTVAITSRGPDGGIGIGDYHAVGGGESAYVAFDPDHPRYVYAGSYLGFITEYDQETGFERSLKLDPTLGFGVPPKEREHRYNWNAPIIVSAHDPAVVYYGANVVFRTDDRGATWRAISPDLTRDEEDKQGPMGRPITNEVSENYNTLATLAESPHDANVLWAGSDDGLVHVTRDGGETWQDVTPRGPGEALVNAIEASPHAPGTAYAVITRYKFNDFTPMIFKTTDYGRRWQNIARGLPEGEFARVVREDPVREGLLFAGTETGIHVSFDGGGTWQRFQRNLPHVPVTDLKVNLGDLVVSTQGRGFWVMDDISPLRAMSEEAREAPVHLFAPRAAVFFNTVADVAPNDVENPPGGAWLYFTVADPEEAGDITIEILDAEGGVVRTFVSESENGDGETEFETFEVEQGLNRLVWDLTAEPVKPLEGYFTYLPFFGTHNVPPGEYAVRLTAGEVEQTRPLAVRQDPRAPYTEDAAREHEALAFEAYRKVRKLHDAILDIKVVKEQAEAKAALAKKAGFPDDLKAKAEALVEAIDGWIGTLLSLEREGFQDALNWPDRYLDDLHAAYAFAAAITPPATEQQVENIRAVLDRWDGVMAEREQILNQELAAFNAAYDELGLPAIVVPKESQDTPGEPPAEAEAF